MEELTIEQAFGNLKELVFKGVPFQGSLVEIEQKKQAVEKLFETIENALDLKQQEDVE